METLQLSPLNERSVIGACGWQQNSTQQMHFSFRRYMYNSLVRRMAEFITMANTLTGKFVMISFYKRSLIFFLLKPEMSFACETHGSVSNIYLALEWTFQHSTRTATTLANMHRFFCWWLASILWMKSKIHIRIRCFNLISKNDVVRRNLTNYLWYYWLHIVRLVFISVDVAGHGACGGTQLWNDKTSYLMNTSSPHICIALRARCMLVLQANSAQKKVRKKTAGPRDLDNAANVKSKDSFTHNRARRHTNTQALDGFHRGRNRKRIDKSPIPNQLALALSMYVRCNHYNHHCWLLFADAVCCAPMGSVTRYHKMRCTCVYKCVGKKSDGKTFEAR